MSPPATNVRPPTYAEALAEPLPPTYAQVWGEATGAIIAAPLQAHTVTHDTFDVATQLELGRLSPLGAQQALRPPAPQDPQQRVHTTPRRHTGLCGGVAALGAFGTALTGFVVTVVGTSTSQPAAEHAGEVLLVLGASFGVLICGCGRRG